MLYKILTLLAVLAVTFWGNSTVDAALLDAYKNMAVNRSFQIKLQPVLSEQRRSSRPINGTNGIAGATLLVISGNNAYAEENWPEYKMNFIMGTYLFSPPLVIGEKFTKAVINA